MSHKAAASLAKGERLTIVERATPSPGPGQILIEVKAVALNPVDHGMRDAGLPPVPAYPTVFGCDTAGLIAKTGKDVDAALSIDTRVAAFASMFYNQGNPDYGAFQQYVLVPADAIVVLPEAITFDDAAVLPLATLTALSSWTTIGLSIDTIFTSQDKQAILIWGGSSSVGAIAIQAAKLMGYTVYTTASTQNHQYLKKLGADAVFDYKDANVVAEIVSSIKREGLTLDHAHCATGSLQQVLDVLKETKGDAMGRVAHAPLLLPDAPTAENIEVKFVMPPTDPVEWPKHLRKCFREWLQGGLDSGKVVPAPRVQLEQGGMNGLNDALDVLKAGVSGTKVVVPL